MPVSLRRPGTLTRPQEPLRPFARARSGAQAPADVDGAVLEALIHWRGDRSTQLNMPVFLVLSMPTMREIAERVPDSLDDLGRVSGMGPVKLEQFGHELLALIRAHRSG